MVNVMIKKEEKDDKIKNNIPGKRGYGGARGRVGPADGDPVLTCDKGAGHADRPSLSVAVNIEGAVRTLHDRDVVPLIGQQQPVAQGVDRKIVGDASRQPAA